MMMSGFAISLRWIDPDGFWYLIRRGREPLEALRVGGEGRHQRDAALLGELPVRTTPLLSERFVYPGRNNPCAYFRLYRLVSICRSRLESW
jgi:hypothetical protein